MAASKKKAAAKPKAAPKRTQRARTKTPSGVIFHRAKEYKEIPSGDGVMRCEAGDYVVTTEGGTVVMPPSVFAREHPELLD